MTGQIRLGAGILNQTPLDWEGNLRRVIAAVEQARSQNVSILCLPELCLTGYGCEDMFLAQHVLDTAWKMLLRLLPQTMGLAVTAGLPVLLDGHVYNAVAMLVDTRLLGLSLKQNLASDGLHYEPRWFRAWPRETQTLYYSAVGSIPAGDLRYEICGLRTGLEICEDAWVPDRPGQRLAAAGVDVILNPSASHFAFGKQQQRERLVLEGSEAFDCSYVYANLVGNESGRAIYDGGGMIADSGRMLQSGPRLRFGEVQVISSDASVRRGAGTSAVAASTPSDCSIPLIRSGWNPVAASGTESVSDLRNHRKVLPEATAGEADKAEEFTRAVALGLFDYLRKSRSRGFVISMSGGADSTACAVLVRAAAELVFLELDAAERQHLLGYLQDDAVCRDADALTARLLTGVYQGTCNSSETTRQAAELVTHALGGVFLELDIDSLVTGYRVAIEQAIGRNLSWQHDDIALQNIQARTRSPSVWMLANLQGALLLATSNRSEASVGYTTMDGDTSGGLSPIAGIDKNYLRSWLQIMQTVGAAGIGPFPVLRLVNEQQPTAELRPRECGQTDEGDLMPYAVLERIEQLAIRERQAPVEVLRALSAELPDQPVEQLVIWVRRFFQLWSINQWKRERIAPSFHLDEHNLVPRTWCRFPIRSGGFRHELDEMDRAAAELRPQS